MATVQYRIQYLDDTDPFNITNFPEPTRPPVYTFLTNVPLINQIAGVKRLLKTPHRVSTVARYRLFVEQDITFKRTRSPSNACL